MKALSIVGRDAAAAADRIAARLARDGRVALVERANATADGGAIDARSEVSTTYRFGDDGWSASGDGMDLDGALDRLAPDHDFALVVGFPEADLPRIAIGDDSSDAFRSAPSSETLDPDAIVDALDGIESRETLESLVARVKNSPSADRAGAIATFTGRVRERDHTDDDPTVHLQFEKYENVADERMAEIAADLAAREGVYEVAMHHRTGVVPSGEDIVFVVVLAGHRSEAFRTVEDGIDRLKDEVPIFKKEVTAEDEFWLHEI